MSLNTKDIRDYLLETNAIEEAEAILLQSFLNKDDNAKKVTKSPSGSIMNNNTEKKENRDSYNAVKLADLFESYEKKELLGPTHVSSNPRKGRAPASILDHGSFDALSSDEIEKLAQEEIWKLEQQKISIQRKVEDQRLWNEQQEKLKQAATTKNVPSSTANGNKYLDIDTTYELQNKLQSISKNHVTKTAQYQANILQAQQDLQSLTNQSHAVNHDNFAYSAPLNTELSSYVKKYLGGNESGMGNAKQGSNTIAAPSSTVSDDLYRKSRLDNILTNISHDSYLQEKQAHIQQLRNTESERQRYDSITITANNIPGSNGNLRTNNDLDNLFKQRDVPVTQFLDHWLQEDLQNVSISTGNADTANTSAVQRPSSTGNSSFSNQKVSLPTSAISATRNTDIYPSQKTTVPSSAAIAKFNNGSVEANVNNEGTPIGNKSNKRATYFSSSDDMLNNNGYNGNASSPIKHISNSLVDNLASRGPANVYPGQSSSYQHNNNANVLDQFRHFQPQYNQQPYSLGYGPPYGNSPGLLPVTGPQYPGFGAGPVNMHPYVPTNPFDPTQQSLLIENMQLKQQLQYQQPPLAQQNMQNGYNPSFFGNTPFEQARAAALQQAFASNNSNNNANNPITNNEVANNIPRNPQDLSTPRVPPLNNVGNNNSNNSSNNNIPAIKSLKFQQEEGKKQEEIRMLELELAKVKQHKELTDFQQQVEQESSYKFKEKEYELWIQESKYQLQKLKMQQVLLKEQKLLTLQEQEYEQLKNGGTGLTGGVANAGGNSSAAVENGINPLLYRLREECGVKNQYLPVDVLSKGLSLIVDAVYIPLKYRENLLTIAENNESNAGPDSNNNSLGNSSLKTAIYRIAIGIYDNAGKNVMKLKASEWFPFFSSSTVVTSSDTSNNPPAPSGQSVNPNTALDVFSQFSKTTIFQDLLVDDLMLQTKDAYTSGGYKVLFEIQHKENEQGIQKSFGWGIFPLTVYIVPNQPQIVLLPDRVSALTPDSMYSYCIANNCWRIPIRKGISDPHCNPFNTSIEVVEEQFKDAFILMRCIDANDFIFAKRWNLLLPNVTTVLPNEKDILKFYEEILSKTKSSNTSNDIVLPESSNDALVPSSSRSEKRVPPLSRQQSIQNALQQPPLSRGMTPNRSAKVSTAPGLSRGASGLGNLANSNSNASLGPGRNNMESVPEESDDLPPTPKQMNDARQPSQKFPVPPISLPRSTQQHWIPGPLMGPCDSKYQRGDGIDLYLDAARFLPDNVTVTRISIRFFNTNKEQIGTTYECLGKLTSSKLSPAFNYKIELRNSNGAYPATMIGLIRLDTIDASTMLSGGIGYCCFKLFATRDRQYISSDSAPSASNAIYLNTGSFQLPVYFGKFPAKIGQFSESMLSSNGMQCLPLTSVLIRVCVAPKAKDGLTCISKNEYPSNEWDKLGLNIPMPKYNDGVYMNQGSAEPTPQQLLIYEKKAQMGSNVTSEQAFLQALNSSNTRIEMFPKRPKAVTTKPSAETNNTTGKTPSNPAGSVVPNTARNATNLPTTTTMSPEEEKWWNSLLPSLDQMKRSIDYTMSAPYHPEIGCYVSVLGIHHLPDDTTSSTTSLASGLNLFGSGANNAAANNTVPTTFTLHKVLISVCPPGMFYRNPTLFNPTSGAAGNNNNANFTPSHSRDHVNTVYVSKTYDLDQCILQKEYRFAEEDALFLPLEMSKQLYLLCEVRSLLVDMNPPTTNTNAGSGAKKAVSTKVDKTVNTAATANKTTITTPGNDGNPATISLDFTTYSKKTYWTIIPLSSELFPGHGQYEYVSSGIFQLPLIEGTLPFTDLFVDSMSNNIATKNPLNEITNRLANTSNVAAWKLVDGASITIQISHPVLKSALNGNTMVTSSSSAGGILASAIEQNILDTRYVKHLLDKAQDGYYGNSLQSIDSFSLVPVTAKQTVASSKMKANNTAASSTNKRTLTQAFAKVQDVGATMKTIHEKFCNQLGI